MTPDKPEAAPVDHLRFHRGHAHLAPTFGNDTFALKAEAPDCLLFYRMGDFFELFFDDAAVAASTLDIALTARGEHQGVAVPMCGVTNTLGRPSSG